MDITRHLPDAAVARLQRSRLEYRHLRIAAKALGASRAALGVAAVTRPDLPAGPWVGDAAQLPAVQVLGRALGGRDLALGLGALGALVVADRPALAGRAASHEQTAPPGPATPDGRASPHEQVAPDGRATTSERRACWWLAAGGCADAVDVAATLLAWPHLPARGRWLVLGAAAGATVASAVLCAGLSTGSSAPH